MWMPDIPKRFHLPKNITSKSRCLRISLMQTVDLLITHAAQLLTCASTTPKRGTAMRDVGLINDGAIAVHAGRFVAIGTTADITANYQAQNIIDASGKVVCPGFVDPHTHLVYAG